MKIKKEFVNLLIFCVPVILTYVIGTLKALITPVEFFFILGGILTLFISISLIQIAFYILLQQKTIIQIENTDFECSYDNRKQCCIKEYLKELKKSDKIKALISERVLNNYKLILAEDMHKLESEFRYKNSNDKEVWIFSYDLSSEVLGDLSQNIAFENIINGVKYVEFYQDDIKNHEKTEENIFNFLNNIPENSKCNVSFIPLKNNKIEALNILPNLLGSIIFLEKNDKSPLKKKLYFSLRGDEMGEPIYFFMPNCMSNLYYNYFKSIKENQK